MSEHLLTISRRSFCGVTALLVWAPAALAAESSALQIMQASFQTTRFANARFAANLSLRSASGSTQRRNLSGAAKLIGKGAQARLIRFGSPADMAGVATLTIERGASADDLWIYLPAMHRVRRLVTANRADPWVGSDFSFGDILGHKVGDWHHKLDGSEAVGGSDAWRIDSTPASGGIARETGYGRRRSWIRKRDFALLRCDFYTAANELLKSGSFSEFQQLGGGKVQPMVMAMRNVRRGSNSVFRFTQFAVDKAVSASDVAPEALNR